MKNQQQEDTFQQLIQRAWDEVREDEQHQLRPMTRLKLYGALIGDLDTSLFELIVNEARRFPEQSHGLQRYYYLGLVTVEHLVPIWERDISRAEEIDPESGILRNLPYIITAYSKELYQGKKLEEIEVSDPYWGAPNAWHIVIGNLSELLLYSQYMFLKAVYDLFRAVAYQWLPINIDWGSEFTEQTHDTDLDHVECSDFAYHACEAYASFDPNTFTMQPWQRLSDLPIERDASRALEFWKWWLFDAVLRAATFDMS